MNIRKYIGNKAYITKEGRIFGKPVTIIGVHSEKEILVCGEWFGQRKNFLIDSKYLAIQLNK